MLKIPDFGPLLELKKAKKACFLTLHPFFAIALVDDPFLVVLVLSTLPKCSLPREDDVSNPL